MKKTTKGERAIVKGEDLGQAVERAQQAPQEDLGLRVVDVVPAGFRAVTPEESQVMGELGRQLELVLTRKRAVEAEINLKQMEYQNVMAQIGGIRAASDGLRNRLGTKKPGDLIQEKKTGQLYVPIAVKARKPKGTPPALALVPSGKK